MFKTANQKFRISIHAAILIAACVITPAYGEISRGENHFLIDGVKIPVGSEIEVIGPVTYAGGIYMSSGGAALHGMWINGRANQDKIYFHLCRDKPGGWPTYKDFKALKRNIFYKIRGQIIEGRIYCERKAITLVVKEMEPVPAREFRFSDLVNRETTFEGTAAPGGILKIKERPVQIANLTNWPKSVTGKSVFVRGTLRKRQAGYHIDTVSWHPTDLKELVGQNVSLEGVLSKHGNQGYFQYKGKHLNLNLALPNEVETKLTKLARKVPARVNGRLVLENHSAFNEYGQIKESPNVPIFVIREAKIEFLEKNLSVDERNKPIYATLHPVSEGVPELIAESCHRGNEQYNHALARYYVRRNKNVIRTILEDATPHTRDVLAGRMNDAKTIRTIRLIYAAMLAHLNDQRGRSFLIKSIQNHDVDALPDALYCLGAFPEFGTGETRKKTELRWVEPTLLALMRDQSPTNKKAYYSNFLTIADMAMFYSEIPYVLVQIKTDAAHKTLMNYLFSDTAVLRHDWQSLNLVRYWLNSGALFSVEELLKLETMPPNSIGGGFDRGQLLSQFLQHKHYAVLERYLNHKEPYQFYTEFRDNLSPELVEALRPYRKQLKGASKEMVELLLIMAEPDPIPLLLQKLKSPDWKRKDILLQELARLKDR